MKPLTFRIDKDLLERLKAFAVKQERSVSFIVRKAIETYIKK